VIRALDRSAAWTAPAARALVERALAAGPLELRAQGTSMGPWLRPGDRVRLEDRAPRHGDVALAVVRGRLVLHRLRRRRAGRWLLRGDARPRPDGWVGTHEIVAIAVARARSERGWTRLDARWRRWLALGASPLLGVARRARARARRGRGESAVGVA
jgi:hypothetical protein